jgi:hypothetical protein
MSMLVSGARFASAAVQGVGVPGAHVLKDGGIDVA